MSVNSKKQDIQKLEEIGKLLASRLHEARNKRGFLLCPVCHKIFEGTHLIKCPVCRTLISKTFQEICSSNTSEKMELDFFL
jgi:rubrerythrin